MTDNPHALAQIAAITVIDLNEERNWGDCCMCEEYRRLDHVVGYYCGPTHDEIGSVTTEYTDGGIVGGMCVCGGCHDSFYGASAVMTNNPHALALIAAVVVLSATPAWARNLEHLPPAQLPEVMVPVEIETVPPERLAEVCGLTPDRLVGCSILWPGDRCKIILPEGLDIEFEIEVTRHELAHCGGWTHDD